MVLTNVFVTGTDDEVAKTAKAENATATRRWYYLTSSWVYMMPMVAGGIIETVVWCSATMLLGW